MVCPRAYLDICNWLKGFLCACEAALVFSITEALTYTAYYYGWKNSLYFHDTVNDTVTPIPVTSLTTKRSYIQCIEYQHVQISVR